jgi:GT2 family glycosyltransferase
MIEAEKQIVEAERKRLGSERQRLESEKAKLFNEYMGLQCYVADIHSSIGWKLITRYRRVKQRLLPPESGRRAIYNLFLKSVRIIEQEGLKGFFVRVRRRLRFNAHYMKYKLRLDRRRSLNSSPGRRISEHFAFIKRPVHVIMPVFNGYECIENCLDSLFRNTDLSYHTLVVIDDKSTDQRVPEYLRKLQDNKGQRKIEMVFNDENLGFVKTINKGMKSSPSDVIILNSDTILTANWIDKLQRAAYSKTAVATATPLSNYVTINGIPEPFRHNPVPLGMDIETFAEMLERTSLRYYPEVPAGVGFCMYIKKAVLEEMGYFDETRFERGYAEETDFCMRALNKGYIHVLDDATYIYHIGGVSFESIRDPEVLREKNYMIERNLEKLRALHPEYLGLVDHALRKNLAPVHSYINLRLALEKEKIEDTLCDRSKA